MLKVPGSAQFRSADFLIRSRLKGDNPFAAMNVAPKSGLLPNTRLETFVFETKDIDAYVSVQRSAGIKFLSDVQDYGNYQFIQTAPSQFTGNSLGFLQWKGNRGDYASWDSEDLHWHLKKPEHPYLENIRWLDHAATRVKAEERDAAIIEFLRPY